MDRHPLHQIPGLPQQRIDVLRTLWIETAEEVLAIAASEDGRKRLQQVLGVDQAGWDEIFKVLTETVGLEKAKELGEPAPGGPLGALLSEEQRKRFGM